MTHNAVYHVSDRPMPPFCVPIQAPKERDAGAAAAGAGRGMGRYVRQPVDLACFGNGRDLLPHLEPMSQIKPTPPLNSTSAPAPAPASAGGRRGRRGAGRSPAVHRRLQRHGQVPRRLIHGYERM